MLQSSIFRNLRGALALPASAAALSSVTVFGAQAAGADSPDAFVERLARFGQTVGRTAHFLHDSFSSGPRIDIVKVTVVVTGILVALSLLRILARYVHHRSADFTRHRGM
jgi:hypothetical protein